MAFRSQPTEEPQVADPVKDGGEPDFAESEPDQESKKSELSRLATLLDRARSTRSGRLALRIGIAALGAVIIAIGIVLLPLPGPGWLIILAGLALLAMEFAWARRLLHFTRAQLVRWTRLVREGSWLVRIVSVGGLFLVVGGALLLSLRILA